MFNVTNVNVTVKQKNCMCLLCVDLKVSVETLRLCSLVRLHRQCICSVPAYSSFSSATTLRFLLSLRCCLNGEINGSK